MGERKGEKGGLWEKERQNKKKPLNQGHLTTPGGPALLNKLGSGQAGPKTRGAGKEGPKKKTESR